MPANPSSVQSIDRVFDIIETLSSASHGLTLTDLANEVQLHVSTTHRLLSSLATRGYVQKDIETGKYRLTTRLFEVGSRVVGGMNLLSVARPYLERLADATSETIHLVTREGDEVVYLYKEDTSNHLVRMSSFVGLRIPMYCTAMGKSILAYLPEHEVQEIWNRTTITAYTPLTHIHYEDLYADLKQIRQQGYAIDRGEHERGILCVAAPILDFSGTPIGAISISGPSSRINEDCLRSFAQQIALSANSITTLLGGSPIPHHTNQADTSPHVGRGGRTHDGQSSSTGYSL